MPKQKFAVKPLSHAVLVAMAVSCSALALGGSPAAFAMGQGPVASQEARSDAQIQADVEKQLKAPGISGQGVTAATADGVVTLTGSVTDQVTSQLAENATSSVPGVKSVQNKLMIGDLPASPTESSDPAVAGSAQAPVPPATPAQPALPADGEPQQGSTAGWGPAGPPPDAVNGQVPPQPQDGAAPQPQAGTSYGVPPGYPQPQYPNGVAPTRPQYRSQQYQQAPAPRPQYLRPSGPVTIPSGALLTVRLQNAIDARHLQPGDIFISNVSRDVFQDGALALPVGATLEGKVVAVKKPGAFSGGGYIQLQLTQLDLDGHSYPMVSDVFATGTPGKGAQSAANTIGGAAFGALLGAAVGGGSGAAIGAVAGGGAGAAVSTASPAPRTYIPAEAMITFHLGAPLNVQPVSYEEATRLAATMPHGRPALQPRRVYYPAPPGYYPPYY